MAEKITYINSRGQSVELTNRRPFLLESVEGVGDVEAEIQTQKAPYQDGSSYVDSVMEERVLSLKIAILDDDRDLVLANRQFIASVFNPKLGPGTLVYENGETKREIQAVSESVPVFPAGTDNRGNTYQRGLISLICPSPFWLDSFVSGEQMSYLMGGLKFPLRLGTSFSQRGFKKKLINVGDVATAVKIEFKGPATNPVVYNRTTGEFFRVRRTLAETDKLVVNTEFGNKSVVVVAEDGTETNVFNWIDLESTFWSLVQGDNIIEFGSDSDSTKSRVLVSYKNRYLSV